MRQQNVHRLFEFSVTLKGLHALLELGTGAAVLSLSPVVVSDFFVSFARHEQARGWPGFVIQFLLHMARVAVHGGQQFAGIYLLIVGVINLGLVIGLLTGALWSYPAALTAIALLMGYQLYRYTHTHGIVLIFLTVFDAGVWWVVREEYLFLRSRLLHHEHSPRPEAV